MAAALDDDGELNFVIFFASLCVSEPFDDGDAGDGDSAGDSRSDADDGDGDCCSNFQLLQKAPTQRVPHTLPLWNLVPKTRIGMVFLGPNSIGSVYGPSGLVVSASCLTREHTPHRKLQNSFSPSTWRFMGSHKWG